MSKTQKTDLEKFIELYKGFGIELEAKENEDGDFYLLLEQGDHHKLVGYNFFYSGVYFDKNGKFLQQSFLE